MDVDRQAYFQIWSDIFNSPEPILDDEQTLEIIHLEMVKDDPTMIQHVKNPTEEMCWISYKASPINLQWIRTVPAAICTDACKRDLSLLRYMNQTVRVCKTAVTVNVEALSHMYIQFDEVCWLALSINPLALKYIREPSFSMYMAAVKSNGLALEYVPESFQFPEIIETAIHNDCKAFQFIKRKTQELPILRGYPNALQYSEQTLEQCTEAIQSDYKALRHVKIQTKEICMLALSVDWRALEYVKDQTFDLCVYAISLNKEAVNLIRFPEILSKN